MAAGLITVRLSRTDASPWGFRLQGGKDFGTPLLIQKVNGGSLAERAGLQVGDALVKINNTDVFALRHKDAQDVIVRAGNSFEVTVERGPSVTWKPHVAPVGNIPSPNIMSSAPPAVTKTSLAYNKPASQPIGTGHNLSARPFCGTSTPQGYVKSIGSKQYNNPVGLYSEETIAETLSAQTEVLAGGVLGVNFKKNEKSYNAANSEVLKMVQEADKEPKDPEPESRETSGGGVVVPPPVSGLRHVSAPETKAQSSPQPNLPPGQNVCADCERLIVGVFVRIKDKNLHVECFKCATCGSSLKNVGYYNINNKLYCDIHAKLVARQNPPAPNLDPITLPPGSRIPAAANLVSNLSGLGPQSPQPGTLAPLPFHAPRVTTSHVNAPAPRSPRTQSGPKPYGGPPAAPAPFSTPAAPFSSPAAPYSTPAAPSAPFNAPSAPSNLSKTLPGNNKSSWPPEQGDRSEPCPTATPLYIPPEPQSSAFRSLVQTSTADSTEKTVSEEQISLLTSNKRMSICSSEVSAIAETVDKNNPLDTLTEDSDRPMSPIPFKDLSDSISQRNISQEVISSSQKMAVAMHETIRSETPELEQIMEKRFHYIQQQGRPLTPTGLAMMKLLEAQPTRCLTPDLENIMEKPHGTFSPLPPASVMRPLTPSQVVVFPPEFPPLQPIPPRPQPLQMQHARQVISESFVQETRDGNIIKSELQRDQFSEGSVEPSSFSKRTSVSETTPYVSDKRQLLSEGISEQSNVSIQEKHQSIAELIQEKSQSIAESTQEKRQSIAEAVQEKRQSISESTYEKRQSIAEAVQEKRQSIAESIQEKRQSIAEAVQEKVSSNSEQIITKTQVEEIIKQELNKILAQEKLCSGLITTSTGHITEAMTIAPDRPFTPRPPPEPITLPPETTPYYPPPPPPPPSEVAYQKPQYTTLNAPCPSPMLQALTIAPDRPYSPLLSSFKPIEEPPPEPPKPKISMISALTTAPETPYHLIGAEEKLTEPEPVQKYVTKPSTGAFRPISSDNYQSLSNIKPAPLPVPETLVKNESPQLPVQSFPPVTDELKTAFCTVSSFGSVSKVQSSSSFSSSEKSSTKGEEKRLISISELRSSPSYKMLASEVEQHRLTPSKLTGQTPSMLPYYQQNIGEIPLAHRSNSPIPHQIKAPMIQPLPSPPHYKQPTGQYSRINTVQAMKNLYTQKVAEQYHSQQILPQPLKQIGKSLIDQSSKKITPALGYQPSPLVGKPVMPGDQNIPKSGTVPSNLDRTKQVFKPSIPILNKTEEGKSQIVPWRVIREEPLPDGTTSAPWRKESSSSSSAVDAQSLRTQSTEQIIQSTGKESVEAFGQTLGKQSINGSTQAFRKQSVEGPGQTSRKQSQDQISRKQLTDQNASVAPRRKQSVESAPQPYSGMSLPQTAVPNKQFGPQPTRPSNLPVVNVPPKPSSSTIPDAGPGGAAPKSGIAGTSAPRWGRGLLNPNVGAGARIPLCGQCHKQIRGPFITALGKIWCPEHFVCVNAQCRRPLQDIGFVEESQGLYCEYCFEQYLAPTCSKCNSKIKGDCLNAIGKHFHPECFTCAYCGKLFGNSPFFLEDALPYCENDWNELFTTKCFACGFPIEAGDRWVEALNNNYHSQCFNCTMCKKNLEGQSFYAKGGRPFCKTHAR